MGALGMVRLPTSSCYHVNMDNKVVAKSEPNKRRVPLTDAQVAQLSPAKKAMLVAQAKSAAPIIRR